MSQTTQKDPAPPIEPGTHLDGRYRIVRQLGEGGVGVVYEAEHIHLGLKVAVKVLHDRGNDPDMRVRFEREAKGLALLSHPKIVSATDYGFVHDMPYLVMELLEGESLRELLDRQRPTIEQTIDYTLQILEALGHAHEKGVVHRDLKPPNIWVGGTAAQPQLKLLDFGFAKFLDGGANPMLTGEGIVLGTPAYISPEQASAGAADPRTDLYAVAVLFFEMLTGRRPFEGDPIEMLRGHLTKPPPTLAEVQPGLEGRTALQAVVTKGLEKNPAQRYASTRDFAAALEAIPTVERTPIVYAGALGSADAVNEPRDTEVESVSAGALVDAVNPNATMQLDAGDLEALELGAQRAAATAHTTAGTPSAQSASPQGSRGPTPIESAETAWSGGRGGQAMDPAAETMIDALPAGRASGHDEWPTSTLAHTPGVARRTQRPWVERAREVGARLVAKVAHLVDTLRRRPKIAIAAGAGLTLTLIVVLALAAASGTKPQPQPTAAAAQSAQAPTTAGGAPAGGATASPEEVLGKSLDGNLTTEDIRKLAAYARENSGDPRAHLVLANAYFERGSLVNAQTRYEWAYRASPESRRTPHMLPNLIEMVGRAQTSNRASTLIQRAYGSEARDAVARALEKAEPKSYSARRLDVLRRKLGADTN